MKRRCSSVLDSLYVWIFDHITYAIVPCTCSCWLFRLYWISPVNEQANTWNEKANPSNGLMSPSTNDSFLCSFFTAMFLGCFFFSNPQWTSFCCYLSSQTIINLQMLNPILISQRSSFLACKQHLTQSILPVKGTQQFITKWQCSKPPRGTRYSCPVTPFIMAQDTFSELLCQVFLWHNICLILFYGTG